MRLYHGSKNGIQGEIKPDFSRSICDFGKGFYLGDIPEQPIGLIAGWPNHELYEMEFDHVNYGFCNMSGKFFVLANRKGYDSESFIETLMNSEVGEHLYHSPYTDRWIGETYIMAVLEDETPIKTGECFLACM